MNPIKISSSVIARIVAGAPWPLRRQMADQPGSEITANELGGASVSRVTPVNENS